MVRPTKKRDAVALLQCDYRITTRRACSLVGHQRSTHYYRSNGKRDPTALRQSMKDLATARPRYGYRRIHTLLRREGWKDGLERVYRFYKVDALAVRGKVRKKRRAGARVRQPPLLELLRVAQLRADAREFDEAIRLIDEIRSVATERQRRLANLDRSASDVQRAAAERDD